MIVRIPSLPPKTMLVSATKSELVQLAETVKLEGEVSASPTINGIGGVAVFRVVI